MTLTGIGWVDVILVAGALVAALAAIYLKGLRPLWRGLKRLQAFFDKVENLFDMGEELAPEVRNSLFATQAQLVKGQDSLAAGHVEILSELVKTNDRIDSHMDTEEASLEAVAESVIAINATLDARTAQFDAIQQTVTEHLAADNERFDEVGKILIAGQKSLLDKMSTVDASVKSAASITDTTVTLALSGEGTVESHKKDGS